MLAAICVTYRANTDSIIHRRHAPFGRRRLRDLSDSSGCPCSRSLTDEGALHESFWSILHNYPDPIQLAACPSAEGTFGEHPYTLRERGRITRGGKLGSNRAASQRARQGGNVTRARLRGTQPF